jgi:hypothetical protein
MMPLPRRPFEVVQGGVPPRFQGDLNGEMQEIAGSQLNWAWNLELHYSPRPST